MKATSQLQEVLERNVSAGPTVRFEIKSLQSKTNVSGKRLTNQVSIRTPQVIFKTGGEGTANSDRHLRRGSNEAVSIVHRSLRRFGAVAGTGSGRMTGNPKLFRVSSRLRGDVPRWSYSADRHLPEARFWPINRPRQFGNHKSVSEDASPVACQKRIARYYGRRSFITCAVSSLFRQVD